MVREHANGSADGTSVPRSLGRSSNGPADLDDPHERARARDAECAMHRMARSLRAEGHTSQTHGALRWVATYERAIAKGEVKACACSPTPQIASDVATARGKSRPDLTGSERPRAIAPAAPATHSFGGL